MPPGANALQLLAWLRALLVRSLRRASVMLGSFGYTSRFTWFHPTQHAKSDVIRNEPSTFLFSLKFNRS
jgi:hypothetical protein